MSRYPSRLIICDCLSKNPPSLHQKLNSILLPQFTDTLNIYPSPVYQMLNVNWSTFIKGILPALQSHIWNNDTHGGCQLGSGDLGLLPLTMWPTIVSLATVWVSWLLMECLKRWLLHLSLYPFCPIPPHPTHCPSHPPPLLSILMVKTH